MTTKEKAQENNEEQEVIRAIEQQVSETILQDSLATVEVAGKSYDVAPPTIATLIRVSGYIAQMPKLELDEKNAFQMTLAAAKDFDERLLGKTVATLILGAKKAQENEGRRSFFPRMFKRKHTNVDALAIALVNEYSPRGLSTLLSKLLERLEIGDFFVLSTFLDGITMTKPTKVETTEAIAHGQ